MKSGRLIRGRGVPSGVPTADNINVAKEAFDKSLLLVCSKFRAAGSNRLSVNHSYQVEGQWEA